MAKDRHPDEYGDIMVEALRPAILGKNDIVFGYQVWDMDDFEQELTVLFRARGFQKIDRLIAMNALVTDLWFGNDVLLALQADRVSTFTGGNFKKPSAEMELPIKGCKSIVGKSLRDLYVVGEGVAHFDGKTWTKLAVDVGVDELDLGVAILHDGKLYAAGDGGLFIEIDGDKVRRIMTPNKDDLEFTGIFATKAGVFSLSGFQGTAIQGKLDKLVALETPDDVEDFVGVAEYNGAVYWSSVGEDDGTGVWVQSGKKLERAFGDLCAELRPADGYLFGTGEGAVFQFDGEEWKGIVLDYEEGVGQWKAEIGEFEDGEEEDDED